MEIDSVRIQYDSEDDVLVLALREDRPVGALEEPGDVIVSYGEDKEPVSIDPEKKHFGPAPLGVKFLNASARRLARPVNGASRRSFGGLVCPGEMTVTMWRSHAFPRESFGSAEAKAGLPREIVKLISRGEGLDEPAPARPSEASNGGLANDRTSLLFCSVGRA